MLLTNGGILLFPMEDTYRYLLWGGGGISVISFQGTFLKRYFKAKNHIYFSEKKIFFFLWQVKIKYWSYKIPKKKGK